MKFRPGKIKAIVKANASAAEGSQATEKGFLRRGSLAPVKTSGKIKRAMVGKRP